MDMREIQRLLLRIPQDLEAVANGLDERSGHNKVYSDKLDRARKLAGEVGDVFLDERQLEARSFTTSLG